MSSEDEDELLSFTTVGAVAMRLVERLTPVDNEVCEQQARKNERTPKDEGERDGVSEGPVREQITHAAFLMRFDAKQFACPPAANDRAAKRQKVN